MEHAMIVTSNPRRSGQRSSVGMPILAALVALGAATPSFSQVRAPATDPIIVNGRQVGESAQDAARGFVREVSATPVSGQFARWKAPICVKVVGLSDEHAALVAARIRAVAQEARVRLGKPGCQTNLLVAFTDNANALVASITGKESRRLAEQTPDERRLLTASQLPVRWWYDTRTEGADGHRMGGESATLLNAQIEGAATGPGINSKDGSSYVDGYNSSLVGTRIRVVLESATVVIDVKLTEGRTLESVASYAAMVTLARVKLGTAVADQSSILALFAQAENGPQELSLNDRAYLAALYRVPANREARQQERAIAAQMVKFVAAETDQ
jgi:hypothetical protein